MHIKITYIEWYSTCYKNIINSRIISNISCKLSNILFIWMLTSGWFSHQSSRGIEIVRTVKSDKKYNLFEESRRLEIGRNYILCVHALFFGIRTRKRFKSPNSFLTYLAKIYKTWFLELRRGKFKQRSVDRREKGNTKSTNCTEGEV